MKQIEFKSLDGLDIYGHLAIPKSDTPLPAILMISGGIHGGIYLPDGQYDPLHIAITRYLNDAGFATIIVDKRGSNGYGDEYKAHLDLNGKEVDDIIAGAKYLKSLDFICSNQIAIHGTSRGATTAALALTRTDYFKTAILASGFFDIYKEYKYEEQHRSNIWPTRQAIQGRNIEEIPYFERSPINHVGKIKTPILLVHGLDDDIVLPEFSEEYYHALKVNGNDVERITYAQFAHLKEYNYPSHPIGQKYWNDCLTYLRRKL
ncbi:S9 family peptidase [Candidatus Woesearchaeota archaeon]|nr:S9 family peptidase [Candidatus Woesearchaeota archaeon]